MARRASPLGNDKWLKFAMENPIPDQLVYFDYDHIAKAFGGGKRRRDDDEREERPASRERERDDRRPRDEEPRREERSRDRDDDRGADRRPSRDDPPARKPRDEDDYDWARVHDMTRSELEDLIEAKDLDIKPKQAKNDDDLADWVCEEMKIKKPAREERRPAKDDDDDKLAEMRRRRERD